MKKILIIALVLVAGVTFAQSKPRLEQVGPLVKATYYFDNGKVQQEGFFKDGKLDGKWTSYNESGAVVALAEYKEGVKSGKWIIASDKVATKEVDYANNEVVAVRTIKGNAIAKN